MARGVHICMQCVFFLGTIVTEKRILFFFLYHSDFVPPEREESYKIMSVFPLSFVGCLTVWFLVCCWWLSFFPLRVFFSVTKRVAAVPIVYCSCVCECFFGVNSNATATVWMCVIGYDAVKYIYVSDYWLLLRALLSFLLRFSLHYTNTHTQTQKHTSCDYCHSIQCPYLSF